MRTDKGGDWREGERSKQKKKKKKKKHHARTS
jgi:hypothetical protein